MKCLYCNKEVVWETKYWLVEAGVVIGIFCNAYCSLNYHETKNV
jgi:hypothetical protein